MTDIVLALGPSWIWNLSRVGSAQVQSLRAV